MVTAVTHSFVLTPLAWVGQIIVRTIVDKPINHAVFNEDITPVQWAQCAGIGVVAFVGLGCSTRGFQLEEAPRGAIIMYLEIPFVYVAQAIFFKTPTTVVELLGVGLVLLGTV